MTSPLQSVHERSGAEMIDYAGQSIVSTFGLPQIEYASVRKKAGVMDLAHRGIIELTGRDRLSFLNGLITNQVYESKTRAGLSAGNGVYAFLLNPKGRIISDLNVIELGERTLLQLDARMIETVCGILEKYHFSEQVTIAPRTDLHQLFISGPAAATVLEDLGGSGPGAPLANAILKLADQDVVVFRDDIAGAGGYVIIAAAEAIVGIWQRLTDGGVDADARAPMARPFGWAVFNTTRIEAGRPLFGVDFDESVLPAETALLSRAVSLTKGCYVGQEIVARMHSRGQVARMLVGIRMEDDALPIAGAKIHDDRDNEVGGITSSTMSPILSDAAIALGLVKRPFAEPGTKLHVPAEGDTHVGTVVPLPFLPP